MRRFERSKARFGALRPERRMTGVLRAAGPREQDESMAFWRRLSRQMQAATEQVAVAPSTAPARPAKPRAGMQLTGGALARLQALTPQGLEARIDLSITDDWPLAQAFVIISAVAPAKP